MEGYQELKLKLIVEINQSHRINQMLANEPITNKSSYSDIIQALPVLYDKAITNTRLSLNTNSMNRINSFLQTAECIDIYGTGVSYVLAQSAAFKLATLGMECSAYESMFASPVYINFFGIPIISIDYTGTVIPVILAAWFASKCEKLFNRFLPDLVKFFFVPMLTLLVALPVTIIFLGPVTTFGSTLISQFTLTVRSFSPLLAGGIAGATWQILVIFGMHWGFIPVYINNVMTLGYDNVMMPFFACTFAKSAVVLAMFFKTKNKKLKSMQFQTLSPAFLVSLNRRFTVCCCH